MQGGQCADDVVGAEVAVVDHVDFGQTPFSDLHFHQSVGQLLLGQADRHGDKAAIAIRHLEFGQGLANRFKGHRRSDVLFEDRFQVRVLEERVAPDFISVHCERHHIRRFRHRCRVRRRRIHRSKLFAGSLVRPN